MTKHRVATALVACAGLSLGTFVVPAHAQSSFNWNGLYAGASLGSGTADADWSNIVVPSDSGQNLSGTFSSSSVTHGIGDVHVGYNFQSGQIVTGVEAAINFGELKGSDTCIGNYTDFSADCTTNVKWMGDLTGRFGYLPSARTLLYVKGGASVAHVEFSPQNETGFAATGGYGWTSDDRWGTVLGVGVEYAIQSNLTLGLEYDYRDYRTGNTSFTPVDPLTVYNPPFSADTNVKVRTIMARVNYKF